MSHTPSVSITNQEATLAFVIRLSWDQAHGQWRILLKPVNGQDTRLFDTVEAALLYLETAMQQEGTRR
jgi:hypothetical protein